MSALPRAVARRMSWSCGTSARGLLTDAVLELEPLATSKGLRFESAWEGDDAEVPADRGRIAQVFSNLVGNAIKFTSAGGLVRVTGMRRDSTIEYTVVDSGTGISADDVPRHFDRFWKATKASRGGAGLGLFIVKGIIESHGGTVSVESELGTGTRFRFSLPGASETPIAPVYADGKQLTTLKGDRIKEEFIDILENYIKNHCS